MFKLYEFGPFRLDAGSRKVWRAEEQISLTGKQFDVLHAIVRREGSVAGREEIFDEVWPGDKSDVSNLSLRLARHVTDLREKLRSGNEDPNYLENVSGQGYYISVPVKSIPSAPAVPVRSAFFSRTYTLATVAAVLFLLVLIAYLRSRSEEPLVTGFHPLTNDGRPKLGPLVSDDNRLIFLEQIGEAWKAASVPFSGGDVSFLDIPLPVIELADISADGSKLLFSTQDRLVSWPLSGGAPQIIAQDGHTGGWAPDRSTLAFGSGSSLIIANSGGQMASYAPRFNRVESLRWSPDGERISFTLSDPRNRQLSIWQANRFGQQWERMAYTASNQEAHGIWSGDGRRFFFEAGSDPKRDLWVKDRSAKPVRLTNGPFSWTWPLPAKSGKRVFSVGESRRGELTRLDRRTGSWGSYLNGIAAYELDFSRDGNSIAYTRYPDHTIWKAHADGSEPIQVSSPGIEAQQPHWSPDDRRIAFMGRKTSNPWRIFIVDVATTSITEPIPSVDDQGVPTWSSDGHSLVFGDRLMMKDHQEMRIRLFDELSNQLSVLPGSANLWTPRWSPDGAYISALRPDGTALLVSRAGSGEWNTVFEGLALDDSMWSRDSKSIFLMAASGPKTRQLVSIQIEGGRVERLADVTNFPVTEEQWFGLAPDGSVLGLRRAFSQEIYALDYKLR